MKNKEVARRAAVTLVGLVGMFTELLQLQVNLARSPSTLMTAHVLGIVHVRGDVDHLTRQRFDLEASDSIINLIVE